MRRDLLLVTVLLAACARGRQESPAAAQTPPPAAAQSASDAPGTSAREGEGVAPAEAQSTEASGGSGAARDGAATGAPAEGDDRQVGAEASRAMADGGQAGAAAASRSSRAMADGGAGSVHGPSLPTGLGAVLVPPSTPGQSRVRIEGCLAAPEGSADAGTQFPVPPTTRSTASAEPPVSLRTLSTGVLVEHRLDHGCCLKGQVTSKLSGHVLTLTEALSGASCRCMCRSTVRAAVGLKPGAYTLRVVTDDHGERRTAYEGKVTVK
ncbi:hypothetical protein FGE12_05830 [Aggregicoccus sp. 17bor-14]|uniref:hypothetical protein n=1 Tax=Myxococcaceae TaxID=31 RepID=UPI00129CF450|nr:MULTISPECIES: hypothetical protein [Myxococcaceae]MBF5041903.1 hypothetical protein [Simulacricoccus sp. 17bor-14]MRI87684.1 hypothetical protein [Aggregicoccus sp. 17bor-14]